MPTRVLAVAVGPAGSGKTTIFRSCGHMLIGPDFEVDALLQRQRGEEDCWINTHHSSFACYDNVDRYISYLPDALAQVATGVRRSKRHLFTPSKLHRTTVSCMLALTARTPTGSLRKEDVADRVLLFHLDCIESKRPEFDIQQEIKNSRSALMSEYARMVQKALTIPLEEVRVADPAARLADFSRVATRIATGLGPDVKRVTDSAVMRVRRAQHRFPIEENNLASQISDWLSWSSCEKGRGMDVREVSNEGRVILTKDSWKELQEISKDTGVRLNAQNETALGRQLSNLAEALSDEIQVDRKRITSGATWCFRRVQSKGGTDDSQNHNRQENPTDPATLHSKRQ